MIILDKINLDRSDEMRPMCEMVFEVRHNVASHNTTLTSELTAVVDTAASKVTAKLCLQGLEADSFDAARENMALWCERSAAALREVQRLPCDLPMYERRPFQLEAQPGWVQREYAVLAKRYKRCAEPDAPESRSDIRAELRAQRHPLLHIYGCLDKLELLSYGD